MWGSTSVIGWYAFVLGRGFTRKMQPYTSFSPFNSWKLHQCRGLNDYQYLDEADLRYPDHHCIKRPGTIILGKYPSIALAAT